ncbi:Phosphofructokinase [Cynara cardunculus var. scolymus]|uniref:Phosphofructokinase n=1 Tax=Cynara cardunculus var. scolymus TaxID=59895 RepID=A0A124SB95_CYNCS|nr:Phosphofructokinase [Cynara cardunculus var. scolymus]
MEERSNSQMKIEKGDYGYVLEDVPHLTDYIPDLKTHHNPMRFNPAYSVVRQYFVDYDDTVPEKVVVHKDSPRGVHFRRAGPRQKVYFASDEVHACIVTCGGLCPGLNTVIREIVCALYHIYGATRVLGIDGGYRGFYSKNTITLTPKFVNDIHKRGGTILGSSRGGHEKSKIVDSIQDRGINQVYIIGGDGTQKGAAVIYEVIDRSFGFDTAVEEAQKAINAAHVEAESAENGIGVVKLMGRYSEGGLFEYVEKRLKENGHMVIVVAEGAGQELVAQSHSTVAKDASGNRLLKDVGMWLSEKIKVLIFNLIANWLSHADPTYMIRAVPSNPADNIYCTLLAQSCVHGAMAGYTGFISGLVHGRQTYIPFSRIVGHHNTVVITDRMWARLLSSTNQPSFLRPQEVIEFQKAEEQHYLATHALDGENSSSSSGNNN